QGVENFATLIKSFQLKAKTDDAFETAQHIAKTSGILKELYDDKTVEGLARYENLQELLNAVKQFTDNPDAEDKSIGAFLQQVSLLTDADNEADDNDTVSMMTIHASKGLEFKNVFIVGLEEDLFPSQMMLASRADLEEERRLFYVAITRAEKKLFLSFATTRYRFGRLNTCEPSRFLDEIDPKYLRFSKKASLSDQYAETSSPKTDVNFMLKKKPVAKPIAPVTSSHTPSTNFVPSDVRELSAGQRVEHIKFGFGTVKEMDLNGADKKARVEFDQFGEKTLLLSFAKLMIIKS
ncbi:MAG: ATP-binding domain-containing protein, partial [Cytophagales bacterium]|nr:ATP-binding domain-containing protein [Cytophagales bacterium]